MTCDAARIIESQFDQAPSERCHKQLFGPLTTGSAQVAAADIKPRHLCVLIDIWTTTR
jgi:hypothetical protein